MFGIDHFSAVINPPQVGHLDSTMIAIIGDPLGGFPSHQEDCLKISLS